MIKSQKKNGHKKELTVCSECLSLVREEFTKKEFDKMDNIERAITSSAIGQIIEAEARKSETNRIISDIEKLMKDTKYDYSTKFKYGSKEIKSKDVFIIPKEDWFKFKLKSESGEQSD